MSSALDQRPEIDRRIAARRQTVREAGARRRLRWLLVLLGLAGGGALIAWLLFQSSFLAVSEITVAGQQRSAADSIVADAGIVLGVPTVNLPAAEAEAALLADPWVAAANVAVRWPGTVEVTVAEYAPAAWVRTEGGWLLVAVGGAVLDLAESIPDDAPQIDVGPVTGEPGSTLQTREVLGAIRFLNQLPADLAVGASVSGDDANLRAIVGGFVVDLGYPIDMAEKSAALVAILEADVVPAGSVISVVSPERPAVLVPEPAGSTVGGDGAESESDAAGDSGGSEAATNDAGSSDADADKGD